MDKCIYQPLLNDKELELLNLDNFQSVVVNLKHILAQYCLET